VRAGLNVLLSPSTPQLPTDVILLFVRVVLVWVFMYYGAGKLFGTFNGPGLHRTAVYFASLHLRPGMFFAVLGGVTEFGGAVALSLGLATRIAGVALFADMVMAMITATWQYGFLSATPTPGYELNIVIAVLALVSAFLGAGRFSLDWLLAKRLGLAGASGTRGLGA
jgi:putative oxidoreductase